MRRYISIFAVAIALLAATSCKLDGGTQANPNRPNEMLWDRVYSALAEQHQHIQAVAFLNDMLGGVTWSDDNTPTDIEVKDGTYTFTYGNPQYSLTTSYRIVTGGQRLDEGAEWTIYIRYGSYMDDEKIGSVRGVVGKPSRFSIALDSEIGYGTSYRNAIQAEVECAYNDSAKCADISLLTADGLSTDRGYLGAESDYAIEFAAEEPVLFREGELHSGKIEIRYKDYVLQTERRLVVNIVNKIITFAPEN